MKVQSFNGGLNTRLAPQFLPVSSAQECTNVDMAPGTLLPVKDKLATAISTQLYATYFDAEDQWVGKAIPTDFLEFQGKLYWTDGIAPKKYSNGVEHSLGIAPPATAPTLSTFSVSEPIEDFTVENEYNTGGTLPYGDLQYMVVNEKDGIKAKPFQFTVYASSTPSARADGELLGIDRLGLFGDYYFRGSTITTLRGSDRTVKFTDLKGTVADKCTLYRYYKKKWYEVGTLVDETSVVNDTIENISANAELNLDSFTAFDGTYQYTYTYYNVNDGTESAPSPLSDELELDSGYIKVTGLVASTDPQVTHIHLYRIGGNLTKFTKVVRLTNGTTEYEDKLKDSEVDGDLLGSDNYYEAPADLRYLSESYAMLFGAVGSTLRFTPIGKPNAWPPEYSLEFDAPITGLGPVANGLLVFTRYATHIVTGTGPFSLVQQPLRGDQGCISFASIQQVTKGMLCWASADGLCVSSGNNVEVITKGALGQVSLTPVSSAVVDERYYCLEESGSILVWDYRFQPIFYRLDLGVSQLAVANSDLYGWSNGTQYLLFQGTNSLSYTYKTPRYIEGSITTPKVYKKFYFSHKGDIIVDILINDSVVTTKALTGTDTTEVMVPGDKQRGFYVQFNITGTGELLEVDFTASVTRNG